VNPHRERRLSFPTAQWQKLPTTNVIERPYEGRLELVTRYRFDDLVAARSVAVIGASQDPGRIGGRPVHFLRQGGFRGAIYPINAKYSEVQGLRCYPDLASVPGPVDVAIVSVPARDVAGALAACGASGVKGAVVFSSGFGEVGAEGRALQAEIARLARATGVRVIGPNCQGVVAFHQRLNLSFSSAFVDGGEPGPVGLVVQSGAVGGMMAALLRERGVSFSYWISSGNEADVDVPECLEFLARDRHTRVIGAYVESIRDGRRLLDAVAAARAAGKPVVILRAGRSAQSARAAASHTGAMAAEDRVAAALLAQVRATDARDVQELVDDLYAFARVEPPRGRRIAILSNSGGLGVIMADTCARLGLDLPALPERAQQSLRAFLPSFGATGNPVDVTAQVLSDPTLLPRSLEVLLRADEIDLVVVALAMVNRMYPVDAIVRDLLEARSAAGKPVMVTWLASAPEGAGAINAAGLAVFTDATRCLSALAALASSAGTPPILTPPAPAPLAPETARMLAGAGPLDEFTSKAVLRACGVRTSEGRLVATVDEAVAAAREIGFPVALKACATNLSHKSEHGLVKLGLTDPEAVTTAAADVEARLRARGPAAAACRWLVERMAPPGVEVVVGAHRDPTFGPIVLVGLGGIFVEVLGDVAFGLAPLDRARATAMIHALRGYPLLAGARGRAPADEPALVDALVAVSELAWSARDRVAEIDVNPLIVQPRGQGAIAVDALVVTGRQASAGAAPVRTPGGP